MAYDGNNIKDLDPTLPASVALTADEPTNEWDDAMREIKRVCQTEFPNIDGPVTLTQAQLNQLSLSNIQIIQRSGGQMSGPLVSSGDPVDDLDLANKQWVEALFASPPTVAPPDYPYGFISLDQIPRQALTINTLFSTPNTSGEIPIKWVIKLYCVSPEYGYEVGDEIPMVGGAQSDDSVNNFVLGGIQPWASVTAIGVQTGARIFTLDKRPAYTGTLREITPFRWEIAMTASVVAPSPLFTEFIRNPETLAPFNLVETYNEWYSISGVTVAANGSNWDVTDDSPTVYESIDQLCAIEYTAPTGIDTWRVEVIVNKDLSPTAHIGLDIAVFADYTIGGSFTLLSRFTAVFRLDNGDAEERITPGGQTLYVEDLGAQWKFIMEFGRRRDSTAIKVLFLPANGTVWPNESAGGQGVATVQSIHGYRSAYTPP